MGGGGAHTLFLGWSVEHPAQAMRQPSPPLANTPQPTPCLTPLARQTSPALKPPRPPPTFPTAHPHPLNTPSRPYTTSSPHLTYRHYFHPHYFRAPPSRPPPNYLPKAATLAAAVVAAPAADVVDVPDVVVCCWLLMPAAAPDVAALADAGFGWGGHGNGDGTQ